MSAGDQTSQRTDTRRLVRPVAALLAAEVFHIVATLANDGQPKAHHDGFGPPLHVLAVVLTAGLLVWIRRGRPRAHLLTAIAGGAVVVAALVYHVAPIDSGYLNPFSEGATALQWFSVGAGIAAGVWCVVAAVIATRRPVPSAPRRT